MPASIRATNLGRLEKAGFRVASSLPTKRDDRGAQDLVQDFLDLARVTPADLVATGGARSYAEVDAMEDLFYCAHNAARSAQLGGKTVPPGFDPMAGGGVIHERRHALTWCLSPKTKWEETDLST